MRPFVICVALLALPACKEGDVRHMKKLRDDVCACKTSACAEAAMKAVERDKVATNHRTQEMAQEMMECLSKRYEAERPVTEPDDDEPATDPGSAAPASAGTR